MERWTYSGPNKGPEMWIKRAATGALLLALSTSFMIGTAAVASAGSSAEAEFVKLINAERASKGKRALSVRSDLVSVARKQSARMAAKEKIWHNPNLDTDVRGWTVLGENVGMGPAVKSLHQAFMNSKGHRDNILLGEYNQIGVGVVMNGDMMYVTEVFARRASSTATKTATAPRRTSSSSTNSTTPSSASRPATSAAQAPAAKAVAPKPIEPAPRTVDVLVRLTELDEDAA